MSGVLLLYTAIIAPVQIFLWEFNEEECNKFPSLFFDVFVDVFFMVRFAWHRGKLVRLQQMIVLKHGKCRWRLSSISWLARLTCQIRTATTFELLQHNTWQPLMAFGLTVQQACLGPWMTCWHIRSLSWLVSDHSTCSMHERTWVKHSLKIPKNDLTVKSISSTHLCYRKQSCAADRSPSKLNSEARVLRIAKLLRILKIIRILKAVKVIE